IRRIEALTGDRVKAYLARQDQAQSEKMDRLRKEIEDLRAELSALGEKDNVAVRDDENEMIAHKKSLQKKISDMRRKTASDSMDDKNVKDIGGVKFSARVLEGFPAKDLKPMVDDLKKKIGSGVVTLIATDDGKASIVV